MSQAQHRVVRSVFALLWLGANLGCLSGRASWNAIAPLRISDLIDEGGPNAVDAARRASYLLIDEGLEADGRGLSQAAMARYERALQVDATNPYAYLAIARHHVGGREPARALQFLDHAESLLRLRGDPPREVQIHLLGLRGAALYDLGQRARAVELLDRARALAPEIWGDGALAPDELR